MIDTGVAQVEDLGERVVARVDFTPDAGGDDAYGHGTHLAGVIAGNGAASGGKWRGVAPGAKLVSVKVAGPDGSTDVSVVIAALQWVVTHRVQYGIKVLNLSFGTDSVQPYAIDPLNAAVERAWAAGITVVVSSGNRGPGTINKPGDDPFVITVGAVDVHQTADRKDDEVAPFSSSAHHPGRVREARRRRPRHDDRRDPRRGEHDRPGSIRTPSSTATTSRGPARRRPARSSPASPPSCTRRTRPSSRARSRAS